MCRYWLFDWLNEFGITTRRRAEDVLGDRVHLADLRLRAQQAVGLRPGKALVENAILAGRGLDFSVSGVACPNLECRKKQVDELFARVWHYFDRIVASDQYTDELADPAFDCGNAGWRELFIGFLELLMYFRQIGADGIIDFQPKPAVPVGTYAEAARECHLRAVLDGELDVVKAIESGCDFKVKTGRSATSVWLHNPQIGITSRYTLRGKVGRRRAVHQIAHHYVRIEIAALAADVLASRTAGLPLGSIAPPQTLLTSRLGFQAHTQVALALNLPVLRNIPAPELIRLRQDNLDSFCRFRRALRLAIEERISASQSDNASAVAAQVQQDLIIPGIEDIRSRLAVAEKALSKKSAVGITLGTLSTVCGMLAGAPAWAAFGAGAAAVTTLVGNAALKYIGERTATELHDMFFLWKASDHASAHSG